MTELRPTGQVRLSGKARRHIRQEYERLPLERRKPLNAAFKLLRQTEPKADWVEWLSRNLPGGAQ
jgi:hypothetical protein